MTRNIRAITIIALIGSITFFAFSLWITQPASAPDQEKSSSPSPLVPAKSRTDSPSSPNEWTPSVKSSALGASSNPSALRTLSSTGVEIEFDENNPEAAMEQIRSLADKISQRSLQREVVSAVAQKDPQRALALIDTADGLETILLSPVFEAWARQDMNAARAAMLELQGPAAISAVEAVFLVLAETDPAGAVSAAVLLDSPDVRSSALVKSMAAWGQTNFDAALNGALGLPNPVDRAGALVTLVNYLEPAQIKNQTALLGAIMDNVPPGDEYGRTINGLFSSWAQQNPAAASQALMRLPPGPFFDDAVASIATGWAAVERERIKPLQWAVSLPQGKARDNSLNNIMQGWAAEDPAAAGNYALQIKENLPLNALQSVARQWSQSDPRQALAWLDQIPWEEQEERQQRQQILGDVMSIWVRKDPATAANEVLRLPPDDAKPVLSPVLGYWAKKDLPAATQWVGQLPAGSTKDSAIAAVAPQIAQQDLATAVNWASAIGDQRLRQENIETFARKWLRRDKVAATAWIFSAPIPVETRQKLLRP
jgi:hypothetical protein